MNRQQELAINTAILTIGKICTQFVSFLLLPLYTAFLLPEEMGSVDLLNTYVTLLVPLFNWQFESGVFRFLIDCREDYIKQKKIISTVLFTNILQSCAYILFYICVQNYLSSEYKLFLAIDVVLSILLNTLLQIPRGMGNNTNYAIASFISATSTVILNVVFIVVLRTGAWGLFFATVLAKIITIIFIFVSQKIYRLIDHKAVDFSVFKDIFKYSMPLVPNQLAWWAIGVSDRTIVSFALGVAMNGIYSVANKFSSLFITFYNIFNLSWTESVALHINDEDGEEFITDIINSMFRLFSAICLIIIAALPLCFSLLVDESYFEAYYQIPILMLAVLFQVVVGLYSVIYVALKKSVEIAKTSFYAGVINIVVDVMLIGKIGLYAASVSTLVSFAVLAIYRYFHVKKFMNICLEKKLLIITIVMAIIVICLYYYNEIITNILCFVGTIVYAIVMNKIFIKSVIVTIQSKVKDIINRKEGK